MDPLFHVLNILPYSFLRPPRLRLKLPTITLPSTMTVFSLFLLTYFMVVSGVVYDVIVEPPVRPVVFMSGRVNGQYIIEALSYGFMFVLGGLGIILLDLAISPNPTDRFPLPTIDQRILFLPPVSASIGEGFPIYPTPFPGGGVPLFPGSVKPSPGSSRLPLRTP
ncbi:hypothetical protein R6Q59_014512 [Mikania micrantha]